jgi:circadian clock protein KaiB
MTTISLTLYIINHSAISKRAINNINSIFSIIKNSELCQLKIIDLKENPNLAESEKILATPMLVKESPGPKLRIIGDLSNKEKLISLLELEQYDHEKD